MSLLADVEAHGLAEIVVGIMGFALGWVAGLFRSDSHLTGRWDGDLMSADDKYPTHVIKCSLVLARPGRHSNSGFLYYERICPDKSKYLIAGIDELHHYVISRRGFAGYLVELNFTRKVHKKIDNTLDYSQARTEMICTCSSRLKQGPQLSVKAVVVDKETNGAEPNLSKWSGTFHRR